MILLKSFHHSEVREEVGLHVDDSDHFSLVGQMNLVSMPGTTQNKGLVVATFVFLQTSVQTPALQLDTSEVADVVWTPLTDFHGPPLRTGLHSLLLHASAYSGNNRATPAIVQGRAKSVLQRLNPFIIPYPCVFLTGETARTTPNFPPLWGFTFFRTSVFLQALGSTDLFDVLALDKDYRWERSMRAIALREQWELVRSGNVPGLLQGAWEFSKAVVFPCKVSLTDPGQQALEKMTDNQLLEDQEQQLKSKL
jgi:hypothetical protein